MADSTTAAPRKKKLLFKRTTSRTNGATNSKKEDDDDDGVSLFRRVDDELPEVLEEQERRLREKEKRSSSWSAVKTDPDDHDVKRRKLSIDRDDDDHTTRGTRHSVSTSRSSVHGSGSKPKPSISALKDEDEDDIIMDVKGKGREILRPKDILEIKTAQHFTPPHSNDLDDDEVTVLPTPETRGGVSSRKTRSQAQRDPSLNAEEKDEPNTSEADPIVIKSPPDDDDDDLIIQDGPPEPEEEVDDELEEFVRAARERQEERVRQAKLKLERESQAKDSQDMESADHESFEAGHDLNNGSQGPVPEDTVIRICVTSEIPGSKQVMVGRRYNQSFQLVRDQWAISQVPPVPRNQWPLYFLTWKGNRVYGTTTCGSLGVSVERVSRTTQTGTLAGAKYADARQGAGLHDGGLHLEAWTEEVYHEYLQRKERERQRLLGELDDDEDDGQAPGSGSQDTDGGGGDEPEATTRVILKAAKEYEPLRFKVHGETTIDEMIETFRTQRKVPEEKEISLVFDGDKLDGDMTVKDTEIEDMDSLEVHIK